MSFGGEGLVITADLLTKERELVVDFFGDHREWYEKLLRGGQKYPRTSLDSKSDYDVDNENPDENDIAPLDVELLTEVRAKSLIGFFQEYPEAEKALKDYISDQKKSIQQ